MKKDTSGIYSVFTLSLNQSSNLIDYLIKVNIYKPLKNQTLPQQKIALMKYLSESEESTFSIHHDYLDSNDNGCYSWENSESELDEGMIEEKQISDLLNFLSSNSLKVNITK